MLPVSEIARNPTRSDDCCPGSMSQEQATSPETSSVRDTSDSSTVQLESSPSRSGSDVHFTVEGPGAPVMMRLPDYHEFLIQSNVKLHHCVYNPLTNEQVPAQEFKHFKEAWRKRLLCSVCTKLAFEPHVLERCKHPMCAICVAAEIKAQGPNDWITCRDVVEDMAKSEGSPIPPLLPCE
ncbi:hypothetical protein D9757_013249 [Collybiopsis confluens]|uniref:RING-type domain-containing protein n=1 Tax=Collybiopsis confluens TaxID=2823264 RepID=A0A8H5GQL0_9AGAR|nr:hypothetical protein D9757_013249 [Collybiopsis confluens]